MNFWRLIMWTTIFQSKWKRRALLAVKFIFKLAGLWICHHLFWCSIRTCRAEVNQPLVRGLSDKWPKEKRGHEVDKQCGICVWTPGFRSYLCCTLAVGTWRICSESMSLCPCLFPELRIPIQHSSLLWPPGPSSSKGNSYSFHCYPHPHKPRSWIQPQPQN